MRLTGFKKGAASFYVVAFSTLILLIITASFTALVIAQITRSSNADLSKSAYDSALAGVEDAKLAFYNYQNCVSQGAVATAPDGDGVLNCNEILYVMEETEGCDKVSYILGRTDFNADTGQEVLIQESSRAGNNMSQAYTCTQIITGLKDYRATLSSTQQMKVVRPRFDGVDASDIDEVRISWGSNSGQTQLNYRNFDESKNEVTFKSTSLDVPNPPTISVAVLQTAEEFKMSQFDRSIDGRTNRGMVYLVASKKKSAVAKGVLGKNYWGGYDADSNANIIDKIKKDGSTEINALAASNDRTSTNLPFVVYCDPDNAFTGDGFACSARIKLPEPIAEGGAGKRNNDTFVVAVSLPYGRPSTDFKLEFWCKDGVACGDEVGELDEDPEDRRAVMKPGQIGVDSTGRANDLFRRIETRLEGDDNFSLSIMGPLELTGKNDGGSDSITALDKSFSTHCEWEAAFGGPSC